MKKYSLVLVVVLIVVMLASLAGCNTDANDNIPKNLSYVEFEIYCGQSNNFFVEVAIGKRENPVNADGVALGVTDFFEVKLMPLKAVSVKSGDVKVEGDAGTIEGVAKIGVTENDFVYTKLSKSKIGKIKTLTLKFGDIDECIELTDMLIDNISWSEALEIAKIEFEERLKNHDLKREIYVKLTKDRKAVLGNYFWYVCYITENGDFWSLLLDAKDGNIIARR